MNRSDVIVVGAGISGLTAAWRLAQAGQRVKVIEANKRVGGRTLNHRFASGEVVEVGGQWVGPTQERILSLPGRSACRPIRNGTRATTSLSSGIACGPIAALFRSFLPMFCSMSFRLMYAWTAWHGKSP